MLALLVMRYTRPDVPRPYKVSRRTTGFEEYRATVNLLFPFKVQRERRVHEYYVDWRVIEIIANVLKTIVEFVLKYRNNFDGTKCRE